MTPAIMVICGQMIVTTTPQVAIYRCRQSLDRPGTEVPSQRLVADDPPHITAAPGFRPHRRQVI
jgi:hypothetical protein